MEFKSKENKDILGMKTPLVMGQVKGQQWDCVHLYVLLHRKYHKNLRFLLMQFGRVLESNATTFWVELILSPIPFFSTNNEQFVKVLLDNCVKGINDTTWLVGETQVAINYEETFGKKPANN